MQTVKVMGDYVDGKFLRSRGAENRIVSSDPGDSGYRIGSFSVFPAHIDEAVSAARRAFGGWRRRAHTERAHILRKFSAEVVNHRDELIELVATETGKPVWEAEREVRQVEAQLETEIREGVRSVSPFKVGEVSFGLEGSVRYRPLGVIAVLGSAISPVHLPCSQILPALVAGCSVVFKPSKLVPATGQFIAHLFDEIGMPRGVFNLLQGDADYGLALAAHEGVAGVLFTGSCPAGRRLLTALAEQPHKLAALQMGGVNLAVVLEDADLDQAVCECVKGAYLTTGQQYTSTGVVLVHKKVFERFADGFLDITRRLRVGYAFDRGVFMGPLLSKAARERFLDLQQRLVSAGARAVLKGEPLATGRPGHYVGPALLAFEKPESIDALRPEGLSFGPDVVLVPFGSDKEGFDLAAGNRHPFAAAVFSEDREHRARWAEELNYGLLNFNLATTEMTMRLPLIGVGECGNNRPGGVFSQRNCTHPVSSLTANTPFDSARLPKNFPRPKRRD